MPPRMAIPVGHDEWPKRSVSFRGLHQPLAAVLDQAAQTTRGDFDEEPEGQHRK